MPIGRRVLALLGGTAAVALVLGSTHARSQAPRDTRPEEIIRTFAAKESEFLEAWKQYTYRQTAEIRIVSYNGRPTRERLTLVSDVIFHDDGTREVKLTSRRGGLRSVGWTSEDSEVINNLQPFALTSDELSLYEVKYENKERVDELQCYVFAVKPRSTRGVKLGRYFEGRIWVDDQDLQIVRTIGRPVPQNNSNKFPEFETIRQVIDDKYWFPVWTHADDRLRFGGDVAHIEETVTYEDYKRFGANANIQFSTTPDPPKPAKPEPPKP